jgi:hypothetical protein
MTIRASAQSFMRSSAPCLQLATWFWIHPAHLDDGIRVIADFLIAKGRKEDLQAFWEERVLLTLADVRALCAAHPQMFHFTEQRAGDAVVGQPGFAHLVITHRCASQIHVEQEKLWGCADEQEGLFVLTGLRGQQSYFCEVTLLLLLSVLAGSFLAFLCPLLLALCAVSEDSGGASHPRAPTRHRADYFLQAVHQSSAGGPP